MSYYFINNMRNYLYIGFFTFGHWLSELNTRDLFKLYNYYLLARISHNTVIFVK